MLTLTMTLLVLACPTSDARADTVAVPTLARAPRLDGAVHPDEYGKPALRIPTAQGEVCVWIGRRDGYIHVAATLPDSTFYWGDDLVISVDPDGSGGDVPGPGDRQWYLRRTIDSSVVFAADSGRWSAPDHRPRTLGASRHHEDWDVAATTHADHWEVELRIREAVVAPAGAAPRLALRTYDDRPHGWRSWPAPPSAVPAQRVERMPRLWIPIVLR